jgi:glucokinase
LAYAYQTPLTLLRKWKICQPVHLNAKRRNSRKPRVPRLKIKQKLVATLEAELLRRVRAQGGVSRVDLARELNLAPSTAGAYVDRLVEEGFLVERRKETRDYGRPPTLLSLNPEGGRFIGVDFEAHNIMATLVDFSQQPMREIHNTITPSDSVERIIRKIEGAIEELMQNHGRRVLGIGVGVPGTIDPKTQVALHYAHIKGWDRIPLGERLAKRFKVEVFLENNIRSMALAELWFGRARSLDDFVCIGIRTGIAAGIVARRRVLHGKNNRAGEIGQWLCPTAPIEKSPRNQGWEGGRLKPLEEIASVPAIISAVRAASERNGGATRDPGVEFDDLVKAAQNGDRAVTAVLSQVSQTLGWAICQIDGLFNPQKIILAGPLVRLGEKLFGPIRSEVARFCAGWQSQIPVVESSELGSFNGALGAAALALHEWKPRR